MSEPPMLTDHDKRKVWQAALFLWWFAWCEALLFEGIYGADSPWRVVDLLMAPIAICFAVEAWLRLWGKIR